jgi:AcrR family transcriptional regulator
MNEARPKPTPSEGAGVKPNRSMRREDWLDLGLRRLAQGGVEALRLKDLCSSAGKTIGSFYHHFADQETYFKAMMQHWHKTHSQDVMTQIDAVGGAIEQNSEQNSTNATVQAGHLNSAALDLDHAVENGVRNFARQNTMAAQIVQQADQARIAYLAAMVERRFQIPPDLARDLAELEYAAFVGAQSIWGADDSARTDGSTRKDRLSALFDTIVARFIASRD